jgi:hypothetical protein
MHLTSRILGVLLVACWGMVWQSPVLVSGAPQASSDTLAPTTSTNLSPASVAIPLSVFNRNETSRDPFFPNSIRFKKREVVTAKATPPPPVVVTVDLQLRGITGLPGQRIALINNRSLKAGEEANFKSSTGIPVRVRCVEVRDESVVVVIGKDAERKVLTLRR